MKHNKRYLKSKFDNDKLFGYRFMCVLEQYLQRFLVKFLEVDSIEEVDPYFFDVSNISQSTIHLQFYCDFPQSFLVWILPLQFLNLWTLSLASMFLTNSNSWNGYY